MSHLSLKDIISIVSGFPEPTVEQVNALLRHINLTLSTKQALNELADYASKKALDVEEQQKVIQKQQSQLAVKDNEIRKLQDVIENSGAAKLARATQQLQIKDAAITRLKERVNILGNQIHRLNQTISEKNHKLSELNGKIEFIQFDNDTFIEANNTLREEVLKEGFKFPEHDYNSAMFENHIRIHDIVEIKDGSYSVCLRHDKDVLDTSVYGTDEDQWLVVAINVNCPNVVDLNQPVLGRSNNCILKNSKGDVLFANTINLKNVKSRIGDKEIYFKYRRFQ